MYNRYTPQPDGSYRRSRIPDKKPAAVQPPCRPAPPPQPPQNAECPQRNECPKSEPHADSPVGGFLRNLLPKDFDTSDLLIVLLLLLMAGDNAEDKNTALLTLIIYLFQ